MKTYRNGCLNSSVLVWSVAENYIDCTDMCLDEKHCKSVSYSSTSGTCALHWADPHTDQIVASPDCPTYRADVPEREWNIYEVLCDSSTCHSSVEVLYNSKSDQFTFHIQRKRAEKLPHFKFIINESLIKLSMLFLFYIISYFSINFFSHKFSRY